MAPIPYMKLLISVCVVQNNVDSSHNLCFLLVCPAWFAQVPTSNICERLFSKAGCTREQA